MKRILLSIGFFLLVTLVLGFMAPKEFVVMRSIEINATRAQVYDHIKSLEDLHLWSDEMFLDSLLEVVYEGTPGTVGSMATWQTRLSLEEGKEEVMRVVPLNRIETRIRTIRPWESLSHSYFALSGETEPVLLEWRFEGHSPFPFNIRNLFVDMGHIQGEIHDVALNRLKRISERAAKKQQLGIRLESLPSAEYAIKHMTASSDLRPEELIFEKEERSSKKPKIINFQPRILIFDEVNADLVKIGMVIDTSKLSEYVDSEMFVTKEGKAVVVDFEGDYRDLPKRLEGVEDYINQEGWSIVAPVEIAYEINPVNETDTLKWRSQIRYRLLNDEIKIKR